MIYDYNLPAERRRYTISELLLSPCLEFIIFPVLIYTRKRLINFNKFSYAFPIYFQLCPKLHATPTDTSTLGKFSLSIERAPANEQRATTSLMSTATTFSWCWTSTSVYFEKKKKKNKSHLFHHTSIFIH